MDLMQSFRKDVIRILSRHVPRKDIGSGLEKPPGNIGSDLAFPCFVMAKRKKRNPAEMAREISSKLKPSGLVGEVNFYGPYINFYVDWKKASGTLIKGILKEGKDYGKSGPVREKVMVEYSAPNTNKPLHLGHLRNGAIGMAAANILSAAGHDVVRANLYSNRGAHICKSMLAYQKWGRGKVPDIKSDHFVGKFYVMFEKRKTKKLENEVQDMLRKWESGDKETRALWERMDQWGINGFKETYRRFGSEFDVEFRESEFWDKAGPIIEKGLKKKVFVQDGDGAIVANLEKQGMGKKVLKRADGTHIYITNDLALTRHKFEKYDLDKAVWVVGSEQNTYLRQLFKIFELLGFRWAGNCVHLSFGLVHLPEGKMKSREGKVVDADDLIDEMQGMARKEILKRDKKLSRKELDERSLQIGLAAIKYYLLKSDLVKDVVFDPKESISLEGDTGPYIQYSHARAMSILEKSGKPSGKADFSKLIDPKEISLLKHLAGLPEIVRRSARDLRPHYVAGYAFELATKFNEFYQSVPVLNAPKDARPARIALVNAVSQALRNSLALLGIDSPDRM